VPTREPLLVSHEFCRAPLHPGPCKGWKAALEAGRDHTVTHHDLIPAIRTRKARPAKPTPTPAPAPATRARKVKAATSDAPEPDGVVLARQRQAEIDHHRARAEVLAEAEEWIANEGTQKSRARALEQIAHHHGVDGSPDLAGVLVAAHALDTPHLQTAIAKAAAKLGLIKTAAAGDVTGYNGKQMRYLGRTPPRGTLVHIIRPGYSHTLRSGETVQVVHAVAEEASPEEIAARGASIAAATMPSVHHEFCRAPLHPGPCKGWKGALDVAKSAAPAVPRARKAAVPHARDLSKLDDDQLAGRFAQLSKQDTLDEPALRQVIAEMDRREQGPKRPYAPSVDEVGVDAGLESGKGYRAAVADWVGRRKGETTEQAVRRYHNEWLDLSYLQAEQATRGHMLSPAGRAAHVDARSLFSGTLARARKYASEELQRHWAEHPRVSYGEFKAQLMGKLVQVRAARAGSNGRDFI
jgi:hypothetical protein